MVEDLVPVFTAVLGTLTAVFVLLIGNRTTLKRETEKMKQQYEDGVKISIRERKSDIFLDCTSFYLGFSGLISRSLKEQSQEELAKVELLSQEIMAKVVTVCSPGAVRCWIQIRDSLNIVVTNLYALFFRLSSRNSKNESIWKQFESESISLDQATQRVGENLEENTNEIGEFIKMMYSEIGSTNDCFIEFVSMIRRELGDNFGIEYIDFSLSDKAKLSVGDFTEAVDDILSEGINRFYGGG